MDIIICIAQRKKMTHLKSVTHLKVTRLVSRQSYDVNVSLILMPLFFPLDPGLADQDPWAQSSLTPVPTNEVLLEHSQFTC